MRLVGVMVMASIGAAHAGPAPGGVPQPIGLGGGEGAPVGRLDGDRPTMRIGDTKAVGIALEIARRVVKRNQNQMRYCYEQALRKKPDLAGSVRLTVKIDKDGNVTEATSTPIESTVDACLQDRARRWAFPKPNDQAVVIVQLAFRPTSDGVGSITLPQGRIGDKPPPPPVTVTFGKPTITGHLDPKRATYVVTQEIQGYDYCFVLVDSSTPAGLASTTGTLAFDIDGSGQITSTTITGLDMQLAACLHPRLSKRFMVPTDKQPAGLSIQVTFKKTPTKK